MTDEQLAAAREQLFRAPSRTMGGLLRVYGHRADLGLQPFETPAAALPALPAEIVNLPLSRSKHWRFPTQQTRIVTPPDPNPQLTLMFTGFDLPVGDAVPYSKREPISARCLRAYAALFRAAEDFTRANGGQNPFGLFDYEPSIILLDYLGCAPAYTTVRGKQRRRAPPGLITALDEDLAFLAACVVVGNGDIRTEKGEPLLQDFGRVCPAGDRVFVSDRPLVAHARLTWDEVTGFSSAQPRFFQIPIGALRVPVDSVPALIGIGHALRERSTKWFEAGRLSLSARELLGEVCGYDLGKGVRRAGGRQFWQRALEKLAREVSAADYGKLYVADVDVHADTVVTIEPSQLMTTAYDSLRNAQAVKGRGARDRLARGREAPRSFTLPPRRPGRPSHGPLPIGNSMFAPLPPASERAPIPGPELPFAVLPSSSGESTPKPPPPDADTIREFLEELEKVKGTTAEGPLRTALSKYGAVR